MRAPPFPSVVLLGLAACGGPPVPPDLVVVGRRTWDGPVVAVEIVGDEIRAVAPLKGDPPPGALVGDLVTAGFVDAHAHPASLGRTLATLDLVGATTYAETLDRVRTATGEGWLQGRGWDQNDWSDRVDWPVAADLDAILGERPAALRRVDGHAVWVDSAALRLSGIDATTPDPPGGRIHRDAAGAPTGVLVDNAVDLVKIPALPAEEKERQLRAAIHAIAAVGLTGVHDMGVDDETLALYERFDAFGALPIHVWAYVDPTSEAAKRMGSTGPWRGAHQLHVVGIKAYADGALGSRGALLSEPYADEPGAAGLALTPAADLAALAEKTLGAGGQLAVHAIGDRAVTETLDAFAAARKAHPDRDDVRLRVEHVQVLRPDDLARFAKLDVIASMQPTHATSDMPWAEARLGPERVKWTYAWRAVLGARARLAFGSDFPVEAVDPARGVWAAVTRTDAAGAPAGGWRPDQRLTFDEAVAAFTSGAAWAAGAEDRFGSLEAGRAADVTLWRAEGSADAPRLHALATIAAGGVVWREGEAHAHSASSSAARATEPE